MSEKQLKYLLDLLEKKSLVRDGVIVLDELLERLNASTAVKLIESIKYIPQLEASQ